MMNFRKCYENFVIHENRSIMWLLCCRIHQCVKDSWRKHTAVQRKLGEYWRRREVRSIASGGIRLWNIWKFRRTIRIPQIKIFISIPQIKIRLKLCIICISKQSAKREVSDRNIPYKMVEQNFQQNWLLNYVQVSHIVLQHQILSENVNL